MDVVTTERPYAGQLAHERKQARRAALIEAGLELLGTQGVNATSVRAVFHKAGLSQRYFYESFANIDELLVGVFDHVMESTIARMIAELPQAGGDIRTVIAALAKAFAATLDDPRSTRVALIEAWGSEALMRRRVATLHAGAISLAAAVKNGADHAPNDGSVELAAFAIVGGLLESMLAWVDGALNMSRDTLFERFTDISVATMEQALRGGTPNN
jgi:AcrR family transcriptional regulator